jgi:hypothetical protein
LILHSPLWWRWGTRPSPLLRLVLLLGLRARARGIRLAWNGDHVELSLRHPDRVEPLIPPPVYLADELVDELRRLSGWRDRVADWWDRRRNCQVLSERQGTARLVLGQSSAELHYWMLPFHGGVLVELALFPGPGAAERAEVILLEQQAA